MSRAEQIEEIAARWIVRRESPDWSAKDEAELTTWLNQSLGHKAAFWRLRQGWAAADRVGALGFSPTRFGSRLAQPWPAWRKAAPGIGLALAASLALVVGIGTVMLSTSEPPAPAQVAVQTPVGIQRTIALADGSRVELNTATSVRAATGPNGREIWLDKGEAYFDIVHRPDRPFVVHAGSRTVTVLGTRFTVRRDGEKVTVAVLSGRVRVEDGTAESGTRAAVIGQGDIAYAQARGILVALAAPTRVTAMTGWRDGVLVFDNQRLADAVADFNRYTDRPIRISDPAVANIRIGGTFQIRNSAAFLDLLRSAYGLEVRAGRDEILVAPEGGTAEDEGQQPAPRSGS
ncbi:FecR family protein [Sphingomonas azotifigens]|uniref:FecR family protein n=1 Tax=Sphingomonas azotifigens TaxID=330920 RepID=UPI000A02FC7F|nr:FecR domain-containing protein [Sphingomonas azotifigens]